MQMIETPLHTVIAKTFNLNDLVSSISQFYFYQVLSVEFNCGAVRNRLRAWFPGLHMNVCGCKLMHIFGIQLVAGPS